MRFGLGLGAVLLVSVGCSKAPAPTSPATPTASSTTGSTATDTATAQAPKPVDLSQLSGDLKSDAFSFYGLGSTKPKNYDLAVERSGTKAAKPSASTQSMVIEFHGMKDGVASFSETDSGSLLGESTQQLSLEKDGIYINSISPQTLKTPHFLELPAKLGPGVKWSSHQSVDDQGQSVDETLNFHVVGTSSITTPAGKFDALDVVGDGSGSLASKPATFHEESWYVKDFGMVKQVAKIVQGAQTTVITQILSK